MTPLTISPGFRSPPGIAFLTLAMMTSPRLAVRRLVPPSTLMHMHSLARMFFQPGNFHAAGLVHLVFGHDAHRAAATPSYLGRHLVPSRNLSRLLSADPLFAFQHDGVNARNVALHFLNLARCFQAIGRRL